MPWFAALGGAGAAEGIGVGSMFGAPQAASAAPSMGSSMFNSFMNTMGGNAQSGSLQQYMNVANNTSNLINELGPKGSIARGDIGGMMNSANSMTNFGKPSMMNSQQESNITDYQRGSSGNPNIAVTSSQEFARLPKEIQDALLGKILGR